MFADFASKLNTCAYSVGGHGTVASAQLGHNVLQLPARPTAAGLLVVVVEACTAPTRPDAPDEHERRVEVVQMIQTGELTNRDEFNRVILPDDIADTSLTGWVEVREEPLMVFLITWTGSSPDLHCGYEYSADPGAVVTDPLGSGTGNAEPLGEGWY